MKRLKSFIIVVLIGILCFITFSCSQAPDNGNLDGMWHLRTIEDLAEGKITDVKNEQVYYSFQLRMFSLRRADQAIALVGHFTHTSDSLTLYDTAKLDAESIEVTQHELLPFYLTGRKTTYNVVKLNKSNMILRTKERELCFKKF